MKKFLLLSLLVLTIVTLSACQTAPTYDIVTTNYVQYDFARTIVGDKLRVGMVLKPGVEAHGYEPTPQNIITINKAKLFFYTSDIMEPWAKSSIETSNTLTIVVDMSTLVDVEAIDHHHDHEEVSTSSSSMKPTKLGVGDDDDHHDTDPHYWVDLIVAMQMVDIILEKIISIDPDNAAFYTQNAEELHHEIEELHEEIEHYFEHIDESNRVIFHAGHVNLAYFAARYHMSVVSLTEEYAPDGQPTAPQIIQMITRIEQSGHQVLFFEELSNPQVAQTIKTELASRNYTITLLLFHGLHNVSQAEFNAKVTYLSIMNQNFTNLKIALDPYKAVE
ncbi:MAG: zinc ABC transporter substrate-binding protein [bacterium]|nr:zinc ABC transporter substrate-binding protein [bacterium]